MMHRWKPGDALRAPWLNESVSALRANRVRVDGANARKGRSRGGTQLGRNNAHPIWATLSGSSSPYTFTEAFEDSAGAWSAGWRTGTAYEVNGVGSLNGTRHRLIPNRFGGWRFQSLKHAGPCSWTITVLGCQSVARAGVVVTVVYSGGSVSGTTDGSGVVTFTGLPTGAATATSTAPNARWVNTSVIKTLVAGSNTSNLGMSLASGYICLGCSEPVSTTLYYSASRPVDHSGACNPETLSNPLTFSGTLDWFGEYLPPLATPPTFDGQVRLVFSGSLTVYLEDLFGAVVTWSASATASVTCSPFVATAVVNDPRWGCGSGDVTITITE